MRKIATEKIWTGKVMLLETGLKTPGEGKPYIVGCHFGTEIPTEAISNMMYYFYIKYECYDICEEFEVDFFNGVFDCITYPPSDLEEILDMEAIIEGGKRVGTRPKRKSITDQGSTSVTEN